MFSVFVRPKPCKIMATLRDAETPWHLSKLAKSSDTTYVYVTKLVSRMQKEGLVTTEPKGRKRLVKLTEKGMKVANAITELVNQFQS